MEDLKWACELDLNHMYKKHRSDAGYDICCAEDVLVPVIPGRASVKTGLHISLPSNCDAKIEGRSGLARDYGIMVLGGEIDAGYRGEIVVILSACNDKPVSLERGSRIAQLVVRQLYEGPVERVSLEKLGEGERGANGFGSTGGF